MYLKEYLKKFGNKKIKLYVDMDGVIADYDVGKPLKYDEKRPLITSINKLEEISKINNIELYILSITRYSEGIKEKNNWLDINAPFFKKENRIIISKEEKKEKTSPELKSEYLSSIEKDNIIVILIDDDPRILKKVEEDCTNVYLLKDTSLVD